MSCTFKCDGCGKEKSAYFTWEGWTKPANWYQRPYIVSHHDACSSECVEKIKKEFPDIEMIENIDVKHDDRMLLFSVKTSQRDFQRQFVSIENYKAWEEFKHLSELKDRIERSPAFEDWERECTL